jgi:hypothetical protein
MGNPEYAKTVFDHGAKMSKKFNGETHHFTSMFREKLTEIDEIL